jgi:hypothetical protein
VTGWLFPLELKRALGGNGILPKATFWLSLGVTTAVSFGAGWGAKFAMTSLPVWLMIPVTGTVVTVVFLFLASRVLREEIALVTRLFSFRLRNPAEPSPSSRHPAHHEPEE